MLFRIARVKIKVKEKQRGLKCNDSDNTNVEINRIFKLVAKNRHICFMC